MSSHLFYQGLVVGFLAAIPLGPMGMICVQRTFAQGRAAGIASATGLTLAASFWCVVAAQGLSVVSQLFVGRESLAQVLLGLFLISAGTAGLLRGRDQLRVSSSRPNGTLTSHFVTSLMGVILNPVTFVTMTAVLAVMGGVQRNPGVQGLTWLGVAVFVGGMTLWLIITQGIAVLRCHLGERSGLRLNQVLNCCILLLGVVYLIRPFMTQTTG